MKIYPIALVVITALLSEVASSAAESSFVAPATTTNASAQNTQVVRTLQEQDYAVGTAVSWWEEAESTWYDGTIVSYDRDNGTYTIEWEGEEEKETLDPGEELDQMVKDANWTDDSPSDDSAKEDTFPPEATAAPENTFPPEFPEISEGTRVSFMEDDLWHDGVITGYSDGKYSITWDDGLVDTYEDSGEDLIELQQMIQDAEEDNDDDDGAYNDDGAFEEEDDETMAPVDENVQTDPPTDPVSDPAPFEEGEIAIGSVVSFYEDDRWVDGEITGYGDGKYTITWNDGLVDTYEDQGDDLNELQQMLRDAATDDDAPPEDYPGTNTDDTNEEQDQDVTIDQDVTLSEDFPEDFVSDMPSEPPVSSIEIGTSVSVYEDGRWISGEITKHSDGVYTVVWEDDFIDEYDDNGDDFLALQQAVEDFLADDDAPPADYQEADWPIGTPIATFQDDQMWYGHIDDYSNGEYFLVWDNGDTEWQNESDLVRQMVQQAYDSPKPQAKTGAFSMLGETVVALLILATAAIALVFAIRFLRNYYTKKMRQRDMAIEAQAGVYRDAPIRGGEATHYQKKKKKGGAFKKLSNSIV